MQLQSFPVCTLLFEPSDFTKSLCDLVMAVLSTDISRYHKRQPSLCKVDESDLVIEGHSQKLVYEECTTLLIFHVRFDQSLVSFSVLFDQAIP